MSRQRVARNALFSVGQVVFSALALLGTYWLMMRALSIDEIGLWSLVVGSTLVARLSELGLGAGVLRFVAGDLARHDADKAAQTVGMAALGVGVLVGALALALQPALAGYLHRVTPPHLRAAVDMLLPAALLGVVLGAVANVFTSALDGAQRMDLRAAIQVGGSLVQLGLTGLILPRLGVGGLGWVQVGQAGFLLVLTALATVRLIGRPLRAYGGIDRVRLRELLTYGGSLQISALAQLLFEPLLKLLLATFSGLALTGYFDMANRIVVQFRSLVVAAYGALVPHVAAQTGDGAIDPAQVRAIYHEAVALLLFALLPYFAVVAAGLPLALVLWKGHFDATFLQVALFQFAAWTLNLFALPAYLLYVGMGRLRWTMLSHVAIGLIMLVAGSLGGALLGGGGVIAAGGLALVAGSGLVLIAFRREFGVERALQARPPWLPGAVLVGAALSASVLVSVTMLAPRWPVLLGLPAVTAVLAAIVAWSDPMRQTALAQVRTLRRRQT
ncbi:MAG: lipopolysaccharide biosynthesis protein [Novosphingobium sp.]